MPRKSSAAITTLPITDVRSTRLEPRDDASPEIRDVFRELIMSVPASHFRPDDQVLIELYAQAILQSRAAFAELELTGPVNGEGKMSAWTIVLEKSHRSAVALAARLRLCPHSRTSARTVGRQKTPPRKNIWEDY
jgi:hypothetical protein